MGDWDFLYEMNERGYSAEEIADAAGCGVAPWQWKYVDREWVDSQLKDAPEDDVYSIEPCEPFESRDGFPYSYCVINRISCRQSRDAMVHHGHNPQSRSFIGVPG